MVVSGDVYYLSLFDTYKIRGATGIQEATDGWLDSIGFADTTGKMLISMIIIIAISILLFVLKANFTIVLIIDFAVIGLLSLLGFIPVWIILFIVMIVVALIFITRRN